MELLVTAERYQVSSSDPKSKDQQVLLDVEAVDIGTY